MSKRTTHIPSTDLTGLSLITSLPRLSRPSRRTPLHALRALSSPKRRIRRRRNTIVAYLQIEVNTMALAAMLDHLVFCNEEWLCIQYLVRSRKRSFFWSLPVIPPVYVAVIFLAYWSYCQDLWWKDTSEREETLLLLSHEARSRLVCRTSFNKLDRPIIQLGFSLPMIVSKSPKCGPYI